ncbi:MAG: BamA/TamA family outer membrane protein [Bacteroidales bacterium]|jgi:outer membrane protein assembly factor BamA|nr:BamA/TamA family outer membrane protein [Bacteroidales bacterium]
MKRIIFLLLLILLTAATQFSFANFAKKSKAKDTTKTKKDIIKKGWNFGPFPAVGYISDLGFQVGALCDIFYYGDGSKYPEYLHKMNVEVSFYTGAKTLVVHGFYDSKYLLPNNIRLTAAVTYLGDQMADFYGFNGFASPYLNKKQLEADGLSAKSFYKIKRDMVRAFADFQGKFSTHFGWVAGLTYWHYNIGEVTLKHYDTLNNLYDIYTKTDIIPQQDANGGNHLEIKLGATYDTRDHEPDPTKGLCAELILYGSPDIIDRRNNHYLNFQATFRHYVPIYKDYLTLAYRVAYQGNIAGNIPFYLQQNISTLYLKRLRNEGLGGNVSIRGVPLNRVVGKGYAWTNWELRYRFVRFKFIKQNWHMVLNPFFDMGLVTQPYQLDQMKNIAAEAAQNPVQYDYTINPTTEKSLVYSGDKESLHISAGVGLKLIMNKNFALSAEWGIAFDKRERNNGVSIGLNYIF